MRLELWVDSRVVVGMNRGVCFYCNHELALEHVVGFDIVVAVVEMKEWVGFLVGC